MDQFDEESNESHYAEADCCGDGYLLELFPIWLGTPLDKTNAVLGEETRRFRKLFDLIHSDWKVMRRSQRGLRERTVG